MQYRDPLCCLRSLNLIQENFLLSKQISVLSKDFPLVVKIYGLLNNYTHASEFHAVPNVNTKSFKVGPGISDEESKYFKLEIIMIKQLIYILSAITEYSYIKYFIPERFWRMDKENGSLQFKKFDLEELELAIKDLDTYGAINL